MSRKIGIIAWVAATILSVAASTAAVAAVRAQVTDGPEIVSLATLRRATSTTVAEAASPESVVVVESATETTTSPSTTSTTRRPEIVATPGTTIETTTTTTIAPPRSEEPAGASGVETRTFRGGTVTVSFDGETLTLIEAIPDDGYELSIEEQTDRIIAIRFVREGRSSGYVAQVTNGRLQIRVID